MGSTFYLGCQWLLTVLVVRLFDNADQAYEAAGILSLCLSITGIFFIICLFNVRNYQVTEKEGLYTDGDFVFHRILTCLVAFVSCAVFVLIGGYSPYVTLCVLLYMFFKCIEAMLDVYHGIAQTVWRLDIAGKSYVIRGILLIFTFFVTLKLSQNLALSILLMSVACLIPTLLYDVRLISRLKQVKIKASLGKAKSLTVVCIPMVLYGICMNSILPVARLLLEHYHGEITLGYYSTVSTVAVLVQSLVSFVFSPLINLFSDAYQKQDKKAISSLFVKLILLLAGVTALALGASFVAEHFKLLSLVFGSEIEPYAYLLYPTMLASCMTALIWLLGMILVVMRDMKTLFWGSFAGLLLCVLLGALTIQKTVYFGTNLAVLASLALIAVIFLIRFFVYLFSKKEGVAVKTQDQQ